jgi:type III secretory pathway component EscV
MTTAEGETREEEEDEVKTQQEAASKVEQKIESLIVALEVYCFKHNLSIKDFVDAVHQLRCTANDLGVPLERLPSHVKQLESDADRLTEEVEEKKLEKQEALEDYDVTLESLKEYMENRPLFEINEKLREQLDKVTKQRDNYKTQLAIERSDRELRDYNTWAMSEIELEEANDMLGLGGYPTDQRLDLNKFKEIVMDIYQRPTKYIDTIKQFMKTRPELWNKEAR